jgi:hypothetical protein
MTLDEDEVNRTAQRLAPPKWEENARQFDNRVLPRTRYAADTYARVTRAWFYRFSP